jgi:hypothetical protein
MRPPGAWPLCPWGRRSACSNAEGSKEGNEQGWTGRRAADTAALIHGERFQLPNPSALLSLHSPTPSSTPHLPPSSSEQKAGTWTSAQRLRPRERGSGARFGAIGQLSAVHEGICSVLRLECGRDGGSRIGVGCPTEPLAPSALSAEIEMFLRLSLELLPPAPVGGSLWSSAHEPIQRALGALSPSRLAVLGDLQVSGASQSIVTHVGVDPRLPSDRNLHGIPRLPSVTLSRLPRSRGGPQPIRADLAWCTPRSCLWPPEIRTSVQRIRSPSAPPNARARARGVAVSRAAASGAPRGAVGGGGGVVGAMSPTARKGILQRPKTAPRRTKIVPLQAKTGPQRLKTGLQVPRRAARARRDPGAGAGARLRALLIQGASSAGMVVRAGADPRVRRARGLARAAVGESGVSGVNEARGASGGGVEAVRRESVSTWGLVLASS